MREHVSGAVPRRFVVSGAVLLLFSLCSAFARPLLLLSSPFDLCSAVKVAVASGIANARELIEEIRTGRAQYDFVEVGSIFLLVEPGFIAAWFDAGLYC